MSSLRIRFIVIFSSFIFLSCTIISIIAGINIMRTGTILGQQQGKAAIQKAAKIVDGDEFEAFLNDMSEDNPYYEKVRLQLLDEAEAVGCQYLYTMVPVNGTIFKYVIDGSCDPSDEENFSPLGTEEDIEDYGHFPFDVMKTDCIASSNIEKQEEWGYMVSTYKSIVTSSGKIVGFIGVDFSMVELMAALYKEIAVIAGIGLSFLILGLIVIIVFTRSIFGKMDKISQSMERISAGKADLTARIPETGNNELTKLAQNCNKVIANLNNMVSSLKNESSILTETGQELSTRMSDTMQRIKTVSSGVSDISNRITEQSDRISSITSEVRTVENEISGLDSRISNQSEEIQKSSTAVNEMSANIKEVDRNIETIIREYKTLVSESTQGRQMQEQVYEQINNIAKQSENLNEANAAISAIAEQTNLLAMNAAIEAAHAGELGKGFGVVADEIRTLAETSASQSSSIKGLLEGISEAISGIVDTSRSSADAFESVGSKINELEKLIQEVKAGMTNQNYSVENILKSMELLNDTTRDINNASSQIKKSSTNVLSNVQDLQSIASITSEKSLSVSSDMTEMEGATISAVNASEKNQSATQKVSEMINGFKV